MEKIFKPKEINKFAKLTGDFNRLFFDKQYCKNTIFKKPIVQGMLSGSLFSTLIHQQFGNSFYLSQTFKFLKPVYVAEELTVQIKVEEEKFIKNKIIYELQTRLYSKQRMDLCIDGRAKILLFAQD